MPHHHANTLSNLKNQRKAYEATGCKPPFDEIPPVE